jgi:hypothetical protein
MLHDGWRENLSSYIDLYETGTAPFTKESIGLRVHKQGPGQD